MSEPEVSERRRGEPDRSAPERLWSPSQQRVRQAAITGYLSWLAAEKGLRFDGYEALWQWSVTQIEAFWQSIWEWGGVISHSPYRAVLERRVMPGARWFDGATLNYAEHMLARARAAEAATRPALVFRSERVPRLEWTWAQLAERTGALAATLRRLGIGRGDRVVAYLPNIPESVVALLATASVGAIWSSCSTDMGPVGVLDRFRQIEPKLLIAADGHRYGGKDFDRRAIIAQLADGLPQLGHLIVVPYLGDSSSARDVPLSDEARRRVALIGFEQAIAQPAPPQFDAVPFDHPLWVVYSSGTTGMPKPIVHGHGGVLIEMIKGMRLHLDVGADDRFFWFSSTNWIMWNLWVSTLIAGSTILQFDGNPGHPDLGTLWRFAAEERATFFGTSPAFIGLCIKNDVRPREQHDLSAVRTLGSTGSPLTAEQYRWTYRNVGEDLHLASISGGTDPGAAFVGACPVLPVYAGEMQCRCLGAAVAAFDDEGRPVFDEVGELVVTEPMPSMPLYFWGDRDGRRYHDSYFDTWPGVWRHGDWIRLIPRSESVTSVIYGRSDSTINRHGIRMGTSELYRVVDEFPEVLDSLVIDLEYLGRPSFLALFVVLRHAKSADVVDPQLKRRLIEAIRTRLSARHVPDDVFAIPEVPRTMSGKKLEVPVKKILLGQPVERAVNRDAMANPASIDWFVEFARRRG
ncbi:MAG TPA: acetoacetate--CoA ligase [Burkholderiaceae bacterium]|nr:acetoacetate--CoA ligase [Burkholderiaceae bacterium]